MKMPFGSHKGDNIETLSTAYIAWLLSQDAIRFKYPAVMKALCTVLRARFTDFDEIVAELQVDTPPPERWKTKQHAAQRKAERAEKLRELERRRERRAEDLARRFAERRGRQGDSPGGIDDLL